MNRTQKEREQRLQVSVPYAAVTWSRLRQHNLTFGNGRRIDDRPLAALLPLEDAGNGLTKNVDRLIGRSRPVPCLDFPAVFALKYGKAVESIHPEAMTFLTAYEWPGNVRELKNCAARAVILSKGPRLQLMDFPEKISGRKEDPDGRTEAGMAAHFPAQGIKIRDMDITLIRKTLDEKFERYQIQM